jgi:sugar phosphate permease
MTSRIFYGWIVVAVATFALVVSNGLAINGIPIFYKFVQSDLVASGAVPAAGIQTVFGIGPALTFFLAGLAAPVGAYLLAKLQPRRMMIAGCFILGAGLLVYSRANSAAMVYAAHTLLGISLGFVGVLTCVVLTANWFSKYRGRAMGLLLTGTSIGGVVIPQIATPLISEFGWRTAMAAVSLIVFLGLLPAVVFLVKDRPADVGQQVDGLLPGSTDPDAEAAEKHGLTLSAALRTPVFWIFSLTAALVFYAIFVVSQQLNLYLQGPRIGFSARAAANVQSLLFLLSIGGKFLYGFAADVLPARRVMLLSAVTMFLSTIVFLYFNEVTVYVFVILFGLNYGGTFVLLQLLVADYFGLREYGKILGAVTVIETIGGSAGTIITGRVADAYGGDYATAFLGLIVVTAAAMVLVIVLNFSNSRSAASLQPDGASVGTSD